MNQVESETKNEKQIFKDNNSTAIRTNSAVNNVKEIIEGQIT